MRLRNLFIFLREKPSIRKLKAVALLLISSGDIISYFSGFYRLPYLWTTKALNRAATIDYLIVNYPAPPRGGGSFCKKRTKIAERLFRFATGNNSLAIFFK